MKTRLFITSIIAVFLAINNVWSQTDPVATANEVLEPAEYVACMGEDLGSNVLSESATPSGYNVYKYEWFKSEYQSGVGWGAWSLSGYTTWYLPNQANLKSAKWYRKRTFRKWVAPNWYYAYSTSNTIYQIVHTANYEGIIAGDQTICYGETPSKFTSTANGHNGNVGLVLPYLPDIYYRWEKSTDNVNWTTISGDVIDPEYQEGPVTQTTYYRRIKYAGYSWSSLCCFTLTEKPSNVITVTVRPQFLAGSLGNNQSVCYNVTPNSKIQLAGASGGTGSYSYQWQVSTDNVNFSNISGESLTSYSPAYVAGYTYYRLNVNDGVCGVISTNSTYVNGYSDVSAGVIGSSQSICYNTTPSAVTLMTPPSGGDGSYSYNWQNSTDGVNFNDIPGATSTTHGPSALTISTWYRLRVVNACATVYTSAVKKTVYSNLTYGTISGTQTICYNATPTLLNTATSPTGGAGGYSWQWENSINGTDWSVIGGGTSESYQPGTLTQTTYYRRKVTDASCGYGYSQIVTVTVRASFSVGSIGSDQTICFNTAPNILTTTSAPAGGSGSYINSWEYSLDNSTWNVVSGATGTSYQPAAITAKTYYRKGVSDVCASGYTPSIAATVRADVSYGSIGTSQTVCYNGTPTIMTTTVSPTGGTGSFTWQWESSPNNSTWSTLIGATGEGYQPANLTSSMYYRRLVINTCESDYNNTVLITVRPNLVSGSVANNQTICFNNAPSLLVTNTFPSGGTGSYTWQWESSTNNSTWSNVAGETNETYQPAAMSSSMYFRRAETSGSCGTVKTSSILITVNPQLVAGTVKTDQTICYGSTPSLFLTNTYASGGTGSYSYKWQKLIASTWTDISGANLETYTSDPLNGTTYFRRAETSGTCGMVNTNQITVTVYPQFTAGVIGSAQTINYNTAPNGLVSLSSPSGATGSYNYQWQNSPDNSNWASISGATAESYTPTALTAKTYFKRLATSGSCGTIESNVITINVNPQFVAGTVKSDQLICYNFAPSILITNSLPTGGIGAYTYQWQRLIGSTWTDISGANSEGYTPSALTATTQFRRSEFSGTNPTVYTNSVMITVNPQIVAGSVKSDQTVCNNTIPAIFLNNTYPSGGTGVFSYQWQRLIGSTWTDISGATSESYTADPLTATSYFRRAETSGTCGTVNTNQITVTVYAPLTAGVIGSSQTINYNTIPGGLVSLSSPTGATGSYTYQWQNSLDNSNWANISGATAESYTPTALTAKTYFKRSVTSGSCGTIESNGVTITVNPQFIAGSVKSDQTICYNSVPASLVTNTLPTGGIGSYTYQWQKLIGSTWTDISGANSESYTPSALTATTQFRRSEFSGTNPTVYTNSVMITVNPQLVAGSVKSDQTICYGSTPAIFLNNSYPSGGTGTFSYQWQKLIGSTWTDISGATSESYTADPLTATSYFRRSGTSGTCGTVNSNQITVTVYATLTAGVVGSAQTINYNTAPSEIVSISSPTGATGTFTYQWQNSLDNSNWANISGATSESYTPTALTVKTYFKRLASSGSCGTIASNVVTINVYPQLIAGTILSDQTICNGASPSELFSSADPTGGNGTYTYQWQKLVGSTWTNIGGATSESYSSIPLTATTSFRRAESSGTNPKVYSNSVIITVNPVIVAGSVKLDQTICYNSAPAIFLNNIYPTGGTGVFSYQWQKLIGSTWTDISGATSESYTADPLTQTSYFRRAETSGTCGTVNTNQITVTVYAPLTAGVVGSSQTINYNSVPSELLSLSSPTGAAGTYSYQWQKSVDNLNWANISGATADSYTPTALTVKTYFKRLATSGSCATVGSNVVTVTVNPQLIAGSIMSDQTVCNGASPSELLSSTLPTGGNGTYSYQWQKLVGSTWTNIGGATSESYSSIPLMGSTSFRRAESSGTNPIVYTNAVVVSVNPQLVSGSVKSDQSICYGSAPSILLTSTYPSGGTGTFSYQWQQLIGSTWINVSGATTESYTPENLTNTSYYRRAETSGSCGTVYTNQLSMVVYNQFNPGAIGASQTVNHNTAPNEFVSVQTPSGANLTYTYQWQNSLDNSVWSSISGATGESYQAPSLTSKTYYRRIVTSGSCGTRESNVIVINVNGQIEAGEIASNQTICYNTQPVQFTTSTASSGGNGSYSNQWQKTEDGTAWTDITAANNDVYQSIGLTKTTYFRKKVISGGSQAYTNIVTVTVYDNFTSGVIGADQTVCYNTAPSPINSVNLPTGGNGVYTSQWKQSSNGSTWSDIAGATESFYEPVALIAKAYYKKVVTNLCGVKETNIVTVSVNALFSAGTVGSNQTILFGTSPLKLEVSTAPSGGVGSYSYQWQSSVDNSTWTNISGAELSDYTPGVLSQTTHYKRLTTSGSCGTLPTNVVTITVTNEVLVGSIGSDQQICYNAVPSVLTTLTQPSSGVVVNSKNWQSSLDGSVWADITAATNDSYQPSALTVKTYFRKKVVTANNGTIYTNIVTITVSAEFSVGTIGSDHSVCQTYPSTPITTKVQPVGINTVNQWQESTNNASWTDIVGATSDYYDAGVLSVTKYFRKKVTSNCGTGYTESVKVTVNETLKGGSIGSDQAIDYNTAPSPLIGTTPTGGSGELVYQWYYSTNNTDWSVVLSGGNGIDYQPAKLTQTTYFKRKVTSGSCGDAYSNVVTISVYNGLIPGVVGDAQSICYNTSPNILTGTSPSGGAGQYSYQWQLSTDGVNWIDIQGEVGISYKPSSLKVNTYFRRSTTSGNSTVSSNYVMIKVYDETAMPETDIKTVYCKGAKVIVKVVNPVMISYKWYDGQKNYLMDGTNYTIDNLIETQTLLVRAVSSNGCISDYKEQVVNMDNVKAKFTQDITTVTMGNAVKFTSTSVNASNHSWNFYEGDIITEESPWHYYNTIVGDVQKKDVKLNVKSVSGCKDSVLVANAVTIVKPITGVDPMVDNSINIYPNPVKDRLTIKGKEVISMVNVYSVIGNLLVSQKSDGETVSLDLSGFKSGVYIIEVSTLSGGKKNIKIIKQ